MAIDYFSSMAQQVGIPAFWIIILVIWEAVWTAIAMWKSAKNNHLWLFILFFIVNILAIPEIIYLAVTRNKKRKR